MKQTGIETFSAIRTPLSYGLGSSSRVACLRLLATVSDQLSQREVARRTGFQHRSIQLALDALVELGLVARVEGGRDYLVSLNRGHRLAPVIVSLFQQESDGFLELRRELLKAATDGSKISAIVSMVIFGSVARGEDLPSSDLDLLVIARDARSRDRVLDAIQGARASIETRFGIVIRPIAYAASDARRLRRENPLLAEIRRDAIVLHGPPLAEVLNGAD